MCREEKSRFEEESLFWLHNANYKTVERDFSMVIYVTILSISKWPHNTTHKDIIISTVAIFHSSSVYYIIVILGFA